MQRRVTPVSLECWVSALVRFPTNCPSFLPSFPPQKSGFGRKNFPEKEKTAGFKRHKVKFKSEVFSGKLWKILQSASLSLLTCAAISHRMGYQSQITLFSSQTFLSFAQISSQQKSRSSPDSVPLHSTKTPENNHFSSYIFFFPFKSQDQVLTPALRVS